MRHISLAFLTLAHITPPELVSAAAGAGYQGVSVLADTSILPPAMSAGPSYSLIDDPNLRHETMTRAADGGISLDMLEGILLSTSFNPDRCKAAMDMAAELGIPQIATLVVGEIEQAQVEDQLVLMCEMANERGMYVTIEFSGRSKLRSAAATAALVGSGKFPGLRMLIDTLHLGRVGDSPADVAKIPSHFIDCIQLCDGPKVSPSMEAYDHESLFERRIPGEGELPLKAVIEAVQKDALIFLEVPMKSLRDKGVSPLGQARRIMAGGKRVLESAA